jgi:hypothetical protein
MHFCVRHTAVDVADQVRDLFRWLRVRGGFEDGDALDRERLEGDVVADEDLEVPPSTHEHPISKL